MTTKTAIRKKIDVASKATDVVIDNWRTAYDSLRGGVDYNGHGLLWDKSMTACRLYDAKAAIEKALAAINETAWPTNAELDHLENA